MSKPIRLSHAERLGLKRMIDARLREQFVTPRGGAHIREGLLHGSAISWPPLVFVRPREIRPHPTLDEYEHAQR